MSTSEQTDAEAPAKVGRATLVIVFITVFIDLLGFGIVLPLLPRYGAWFNADGMQLGMLMASFSAMQFLFAPLWGALSDRVGRRPILMLGLFGSTCSYGLFGLISSQGRDFLLLGMGPLAWLYVTRIGAGIAGATISTAQAVIADSTGARGRGTGMALIGAAFGIGFTFGPLIGAACVSEDNAVALSNTQIRSMDSWRESADLITADEFITYMQNDNGVLDEASVKSAQQMLAEPRARGEVRELLLTPPSGAPGYVASMLSAIALLLAAFKLQESRRPGTSAGAGRGFRPAILLQHLTAPRLSLILATIFVTTFGFAQFESTLTLLTQRFGYSSRWNYLLYAYVGFVLSLGQGMLVRRLLPRVGEKRMAVSGVGLMTLGFCLLGITGMGILPGSALWLILPVVVIGFSAVTPSVNSLLSQAAGEDEQGAVLGSGQSLSSLARILGPLLGIPLLRQSVSMPYFLGAILIMLGGILIARYRVPAAASDSSTASSAP